jgi:tetratricopeptide (TPR) repeat protein
MFGSSAMDSTPSAKQSLIPTLFKGGLMALALLAPLGSLSWAQDGGRPDQVFVLDSKGSIRQFTGTVIENTLTRVVLKRGDKETSYDNDRVDRVLWGEVSTAFRSGKTFFNRGDYENAAAEYRAAAVEDPREVIKAVARLRAGQALMQLGRTDPSQFPLALDEFERFLSDFSTDRAVPEARALQARCTLLRGGEGDQAAAGALYRGIFQEGAGGDPATGYDPITSLECGLHAAEALIAADDTSAAQEILGILTSSVQERLISLDDAESGAPEKRRRLESLAGEAKLGGGFIMLASNQSSQAETFFKAQLQGAADGAAAVRFGARLGIAEVYLAQGKLREASLEFASVVAIDFTDRDRTARALLGLSKTFGMLGDIDGAAQARARLTTIVESFGDTPSAASARELLK